MHALVLIDVLTYFCSFSIASLRRVPSCSYSSLCFYLLALGFLSLLAPLCYPHCFPLFPWCFPPIFLKLSSGSPTACLLSSCGFPLIFLWLCHGVPVASWVSPMVFCSRACCFLMAFSFFLVAFLWCSCASPMLFLWHSCAFPLTFSIEKSFKKLLISYGFLLAFLLFSYGVDVALPCFPVAFLRFSPAFSIEKSIKHWPFWGAWR